jgi:hypothetical protein
METLTFSKVGNLYVAEFSATGTFALHIERAEGGVIKMEQSSVQGSAFAPVSTFPDYRNALVIEETISSDIFPMYLRIVSENKPTMAVVTFKA